ncbi:MAG: hypothetical protein AAAC47_16360, partial [Pararhizobium sp.]
TFSSEASPISIVDMHAAQCIEGMDRSVWKDPSPSFFAANMISSAEGAAAFKDSMSIAISAEGAQHVIEILRCGS